MDIGLFCDCQHIKLLNDEVHITKLKATYALDKKKNHTFFSMNDLRAYDFFYGYALNIARLMNLEEYKLYGIKSHKCHVFM